MATLVFDEAVEDEWKAPPKARGPSPGVSRLGALRSARGRRAPDPWRRAFQRSLRRKLFPCQPTSRLRLRRYRCVDPLLRRTFSRPPMPTIPGGLAPPPPPSTPAVQAQRPFALTESATSKCPPLECGTGPQVLPEWPHRRRAHRCCRPPNRRARYPRPRPVRRRARCSPRSPAAASHPGSVVEPTPAQAVASAPESPARASDPASFLLQLQGKKTISLRNAVIACAGSALVASLVTGLVVGSRSPEAVRPAEPTKAVAVATTNRRCRSSRPRSRPPRRARRRRANGRASTRSADGGKGRTHGVANVEKPKPKTTKDRRGSLRSRSLRLRTNPPNGNASRRRPARRSRASRSRSPRRILLVVAASGGPGFLKRTRPMPRGRSRGTDGASLLSASLVFSADFFF